MANRKQLEAEAAYADAKFREELAPIGDRIAKARRWNIGGVEAVYRFLMEKFGWLPRDVRALDSEDLNMLVRDDPEVRSLMAPKRPTVKFSEVQRAKRAAR